ncbi:CHAT domain-containing protein [Actinoplanes sp. NPDC026619]|uniref:CHAT domain-containing protein n=1 Tax=Actinoplanes sp. NPDC026619 TaxID=3155798 RepID=UPI00341150B6
MAESRVQLAREWDTLVDQARRLGPEFADLLRPPTAESLRPAVAGGAAILVNVTARRSDALVVTVDGTRPVPLPLTAAEAAELANRHLRRVAELDRAAARLDLAGERVIRHPDGASYQEHYAAVVALQDARDRLDADLTETLARLWDTVAEPALAEQSDGARIWWCPAGLLSFLPLHAAGRPDRPGASVLDRTVSSYTPTLRALARARAGPDTAGRTGQMLVVAVPEAPGEPPLPQALEEAEVVRAAVPAERLTVLAGAEATRAAVLGALPAHDWVHFSCHGALDYEDPSRAGLLLHDGRLTVADLGRGDYPGSFAFLSACHTAAGGIRLPDEVITLAAGVHHSGFRHVLATLWAVDADVALALARSVYAGFTPGAGRPDIAAVTRAAVLERRAAEPGRPSRWAMFTHTGP